MLIVAVAWIYVVGLMSLTEPTIVAGIMTFLIYCVVPLSILFYITGSPGRKLRLAKEARAAQVARDRSAESAASTTTAGKPQDDTL
jgi:hypothetical protein